MVGGKSEIPPTNVVFLFYFFSTFHPAKPANQPTILSPIDILLSLIRFTPSAGYWTPGARHVGGVGVEITKLGPAKVYRNTNAEPVTSSRAPIDAHLPIPSLTADRLGSRGVGGEGIR